MAPTRPSPKKAKPKARLAKKRNTPTPSAIRELISEATTALTQGDALTALARCNTALKDAGLLEEDAAYRPLTGAVLSLQGEAHLETGNHEAAHLSFRGAADADPDGKDGVEKFLYLAQLSPRGGDDSVQWFERGAAALRAQITTLAPRGGAEGSPARTELEARQSKLAEVLCAVAEVYMTDLCDAADAEARCEGLVTEAVALAPESAQAWQTLASVRVSQCREADAHAALRRSLGLWEELPPADPRVPDFAVRVALVRLLLTTGLYDKAIEVADRCVCEDDQSVEMWYLGGFAQKLAGDALKEGGEMETWKSSWADARRWLGRCLRLFAQQEYEDEPLREHAKEILKEIAGEIGEAPAEEGEDDEEEWEDNSDDEEGTSEDERQ